MPSESSCPRCHQPVSPGVRFCPHCGNSQDTGPKTTPRRTPRATTPDPTAVEEYARLFKELTGDGALEDWKLAELERERAAMGVPPSVHQHLVAQLEARGALPVRLSVDTVGMRDFAVGTRCGVALAVLNRSGRALRSVEVELAASTGADVRTARAGLLGPEHHAVLRVYFMPEAMGHHELTALVTATPLRGRAVVMLCEAVGFRVAAKRTAPMANILNIDAGSQRVGKFEGINVGAEGPTGGVLDPGEWREVRLSVVEDARARRWRQQHAALVESADDEERTDPKMSPMVEATPEPPPAPMPPPVAQNRFHYNGPSGQAQLTAQEVADKVAQDRTAPHHLWMSGWPGWKPWSEVQEVAALVAPATPPPPPGGSTFWYSGPDGQAQLSAKAVAQRITQNPAAEHMVWKEGFAGWQDARTVAEITSATDASEPAPPRPPAAPEPGEVRESRTGVVLAWCPPGSFRMGSKDSDSEAHDDEKPRHRVTLSRGFWMTQTPVTQAQWGP